jgi:hypothetical protein
MKKPTEYLVEFEVFTLVAMNSAVVYVITSCSSERSRRFGGTYRLHLQGSRIREVRNKLRFSAASADFLLSLFFDPEDGGDIFLRNVRLSFTSTTRRFVL